MRGSSLDDAQSSLLLALPASTGLAGRRRGCTRKFAFSTSLIVLLVFDFKFVNLWERMGSLRELVKVTHMLLLLQAQINRKENFGYAQLDAGEDLRR